MTASGGETGLARYIDAVQAFLYSRLPARWSRWLIAQSRGKTSHGRRPPRLLVDVSVTVHHDVNTGIQRVVRAWTAHLYQTPSMGLEISPIQATAKGGYRYSGPCFGVSPRQDDVGTPVDAQDGDLFFGVDLAAHLVWRNQRHFLRWKKNGTRIVFVVHDLLPVCHPDWFNPRTGRHFRRWVKVLARYADAIICSSEAVATDCRNWFATHDGDLIPPMAIHVVPLGADISASLPTTPPAGTEHYPQSLIGRDFVLLVGTVEPRKGHACALAAFEALWRRGGITPLVIVGRPGWRTDALQAALTDHPERNHRLFWFNDASDTLLQTLYQEAAGVFIPSKGEGYGLPLVEAMFHGKRVLARDLPVFREIAGDRASYFGQDTPEELAQAVETWLRQDKPASFPPYSPMTWQDSTQRLVTTLQAEARNRI